MRATLSAAAAQLLRSLMSRAGLEHDHLFVSSFRSVDWQSLTFIGERHEICLRLTGPDVATTLSRLRTGIEDAEWQLRGYLVADVIITSEQVADDGSAFVNIEALTLSDQD